MIDKFCRNEYTMIALEGLEISQIYVKEDARMEEMTLGQWIGTIVLCIIVYAVAGAALMAALGSASMLIAA